ncbi:MAG TPA: hypothetical protein VFU39_08410, partial [Sulfuricaulis sp.]|nr:hypothetical protein [Sulfuricaulis sp.]
MTTPRETRVRGRRRMIWIAVIILFGALVLPLSGYVYVAINEAIAATSAAEQQQQTNPRANYWRAIREGNEGYTAASGPYTTSVLIQTGGQNWRQLRTGPVIGTL